MMDVERYGPKACPAFQDFTSEVYLLAVCPQSDEFRERMECLVV